LLLPQEVIQLPRDEQILLIESQPAVKCLKIKYYEERIFKKRLLPKVKIPVQEPYMPNYSNNKKGKEEAKEDKAGIN
jgi:type IV secretion system protein VirD4